MAADRMRFVLAGKRLTFFLLKKVLTDCESVNKFNQSVELSFSSAKVS